MTAPGVIIEPPVEEPAAYGLFSAARMLSLIGHEQLGIRYEALCDQPVRVWPAGCRVPDPVPRTVTVTFTGSRSGDDTAGYTYSGTATATVDTGPYRRIRIQADSQPEVVATTGGDAVDFYSRQSSTATGASVTVTLTDVASGTTTQVTLDQDGATGAFTPTSSTLAVTDPATKDAGNPPVVTEADPFAVYGVETCATGLTLDEQVQRARTRLESVEQRSVERAFWTGEYGTRSALATSNPTVLGDPTAPDALTTGLSRLEQWLGETTATVGTIHANRGVAAVADSESLVRRTGGRTETLLGNLLAFGGGYPRTGPDGHPQQDATGREVWLFATRQVTVRRTEVFVPADSATGAFNTARNTTFVVAERVYVVDIPCTTAAVKVDLSTCRCDGGA